MTEWESDLPLGGVGPSLPCFPRTSKRGCCRRSRAIGKPWSRPAGREIPPLTEKSPQKSASVTISRVLYWVIIYPDPKLPVGSSDCENATGRRMCPLPSCTGWGLQRGQVAKPRVSSYLAFPSLPLAGRYISVALSLESPPPSVRRHPALWCSDFPHASRHAITCSPRTGV